jgi:hypothetical protein
MPGPNPQTGVVSSVLNCEFIEELAMWGGPPGPRPTPAPASVSRVMAEPDQEVRRGRGRPPHRELCVELLIQDTSGAPPQPDEHVDWLRLRA